MRKERLGIDWKPIISALLQEFYEKPFIAGLVPRTLRIPELKGKIDALIGMRRTGKTYLLLQQIQKLRREGVDPTSIFYLNFEDDRLPSLGDGSLTTIVDSFFQLFPQNHQRECHFFFDEIQNAAEWPRVLRRLLDTQNVRMMVTGSSAKLLSKEIATSLRGRSLATEVWPYSFWEWLRATKVPPSLGSKGPKSPKLKDELNQSLELYLKTGGFPETVGLQEFDRRRIHQDYVSVVVLKDIIERYRVKNEPLLRYFVKTLLSQLGRPVSVNKIFNDLKSQGRGIGKNTLYQYLDFISDCFLSFSVPLFSESLRKQQSNPRKIFSVDSGLSFSHTLNLSENLGRLFENLVYVDLRRRGDEIFYYVTKSGHEIDFITKGIDGSLNIYQSCWNIKDQETRDRELHGLKEAEKDLGIRGSIITLENYIQNPENPLEPGFASV